MPLYAYHCPDCSDDVELMVPMVDRDTPRCPSCDTRLLRHRSTPHLAPIGGIPNRLNRHWNESGKAIDRGKVDDFIDRAVKT